MGQNKSSPLIRRKPDWTAFTREIKFLKSMDDVKILIQKTAFVLPRILGTVERWTDVPPSIQIEPTNACNISCITCGRAKSTRPIGRMDFNLFTKIIDDASLIGVKRVQLFLMGEPLLHPKIVKMIEYIKSKGMAFHLTTNGALLIEDMGVAILKAGVTSADYITFSILGFSKEIHEKVMVRISHERVIDNLNKLLRNREKLGINGPVIETVFYAIPENEHEREAFLKYWDKITDHAVNGGTAVKSFMNQSLPDKPKTRTCSLIWDRMAVQWNGDVVMCGEDMNAEYIVGNLREQTIQEIWLGEKLTRLKTLHKQGQFQEIALCKFCDW
jgi:radical SAM protein with 4Fe4S-binding SPASM domain